MLSAIDTIKARAAAPGGAEFLVIGKGPSFSRAKIAASRAVKICINDTINALGAADFCIFNDLVTIAKLDLASMHSTNHFLVPSSPEVIARGVPFWVQNADRLKAMSSKVSYFDLNPGKRHPFGLGSPIHAFNSTYESVIWLLAYAGIRNVKTCGIDYSLAYHSDFAASSPSRSVPFAAMRYYAQVAIDHFEMKVEPL